MILRPRKQADITRVIFSESNISPARSKNKKKNEMAKKCSNKTTTQQVLDQSGTKNNKTSPPTNLESPQTPQKSKASTSKRPLESSSSERSSSQSSILGAIPAVIVKKLDPPRTTKSLSINDITLAAKLTNPIVLMDRYRPPKEATEHSPPTKQEKSQDVQTSSSRTCDDSAKGTGTPKTPDTATASDTSTPPRETKSNAKKFLSTFSDDGSSLENLPEEEQPSKRKRRKGSTKRQCSASFLMGDGSKRKRKLSNRQTLRRKCLEDADHDSDSLTGKVTGQIAKRSYALLNRRFIFVLFYFIFILAN